MKRKLNEVDVPEEISSEFSDFGLDARLVQALAAESFEKPTPVQAKAIPLTLEGKDVLGKFYHDAKT